MDIDRRRLLLMTAGITASVIGALVAAETDTDFVEVGMPTNGSYHPLTRSLIETLPEDEAYRIPRSALLEIETEAFVPYYVCRMRVACERGVDIEAFLRA